MSANCGSGSKSYVHDQLISSLGVTGTQEVLRTAQATPTDLSLVGDWARRGAETYSLIFDVASNGEVYRYILKVCVAGFGDHSGTVGRWMDRRRILAENGITVPALLALAGPAYCEAYIPLSLREALHQYTQQHRDVLIPALAATLARIADLGYNPSRLDDLRSHGRDVTVVDFGADLALPWDGDVVRLIRQYAGLELTGTLKSEILEALESGQLRIGSI